MRFWSIVIFVVLFIASILYLFISIQKDTIKVGLLYSKTGTMSTEEQIIEKMVKYQISKINNEGGLLNRKIEIIEYDGKSDPKEFAKGAEHLISSDVTAIFGCWTSASRKEVKPIIEKYNSLLFYPVQYEGAEESKNIIYMGSTPNQQINPIINYIKEHYGDKIYIVGSDYIYPRMAHLYIDELSKLIGLKIVGYDYPALENKDFKEIVTKIKSSNPDVVINTLNGKSNLDFFKELKIQGLTSSSIPVFSTSIDESSIKLINSKIKDKVLEGHYISNGYFNTIQNNDNKQLKAELEKQYGKDFVLTDAGFNAYMSVEFFKRAVINTKSTDTSKLKSYIKGDSIKFPSGIVYIDSNNNHIHKQMRIGKIAGDEIQIMWNSEVLTKPSPFPIFKSKDFWIEHTRKLYKSWGDNWQAQSNKGIKDE
ncbi:MAG: transporter substrate-binding protein [Campylobacterota bacterium]|nr:transporter substrate-binding protein [Campylobacterota bacterium]